MEDFKSVFNSAYTVITIIISILGGIIALYKRYTKNKKNLDIYLNYVKNRFFFPLSFVKIIISKCRILQDSDFINYSIALNNGYYSKSTKWINVKIGSEIKKIEIPYSEIINYIENPESSIKIIDSNLGEQYSLSNDIIEKTEDILAEFLSKKPKTYNGRTLRFQFLKQIDTSNFECILQPATYFDQIRTNLTLDMPLKGDEEKSIRIIDLEKDKVLKPLSYSIMANTIGVSAVWYTTVPQKEKRNGIQFFLKPRKLDTGVFYNSLGSISGVVEPPENDVFDVDTLEEYIKRELLREFHEENPAAKFFFKENDIEIKPLAFVRELTRGGKPQFMFVIKTPYIDDSIMAKHFNKSLEFDDSMISRLKLYDLSPETYVNYLYALSYIQKDEYLHYIDLN